MHLSTIDTRLLENAENRNLSFSHVLGRVVSSQVPWFVKADHEKKETSRLPDSFLPSVVSHGEQTLRAVTHDCMQ